MSLAYVCLVQCTVATVRTHLILVAALTSDRHLSYVVTLEKKKLVSQTQCRINYCAGCTMLVWDPRPPANVLPHCFGILACERRENVHKPQMLSKVSVDEVFMHYLQNMPATGGFSPYSYRRSASGLHWGTSIPQTPNLPTPGKTAAPC